MISKVQNTPKQQTFTANWKDARKVIASLPENHKFFKGLKYTLDNRTISNKPVVLARLDAAFKVTKKRLTDGKTEIFNLTMPDFSNIYKNPKKFFMGLREQYLLGNMTPPYTGGKQYYFKQNWLEKKKDETILTVTEKDNLSSVANFLLYRGKSLVKEFKKAGLENPKEIEIK